MSGHPSCYTHRTYYLTCDEFDQIVKRGDGRCEICDKHGSETPRGSLVIDHLHGYGWGNLVRGMLCDWCNVMMGRVDRHKEAPTSEAMNYMRNAWFARQSMFGRGFLVNPSYPRWEWPGSKTHAAVATIRGGRR